MFRQEIKGLIQNKYFKPLFKFGLFFVFAFFVFGGQLPFTSNFIFSPQIALAANITVAKTGNWSATSTWVGGVVPTAADSVTIASSTAGQTVTVDVNTAVANYVYVASSTNTGILVFNSGSKLTVTNTFTLGQATYAGTLTMTAGGTLVAGTIAGVSGKCTFTQGAGSIQITGTQTLPTACFLTFNDLTIKGAVTTGAAATTSTLSIVSGTFSAAAFPFTVSATTTVSGTLSITSATGAKTFAGNIIISSGGTWNNSGNAAVSVKNGISNSGTFTSGTGTYTFDTNNQILSGGVIVFSGSVQVTGITVTNNATVTITGNFTGTGSWTQGVNSSLTVSGAGSAIGISGTFDGTAVGNTVIYSKSAQPQTVAAANYYNLTITGAHGSSSVTITGAVNIAGTFITAATFTSGGYIVTGSTITYNGTGNQTVLTSFSYNNLNLAPAASGNPTYTLASTTGQTLTVGGTLTVGDGTNPVVVTANLNAPDIYIASTTIINAGASWIFGAGTQTHAGSVTINGSASASSSGSTIVTGNLSGFGTVNLTGGTFEQRGTANFSNSSPWIFNTLNIGTGGTANITAVNNATVTATSLAIGSAASLNAGTKTWILTASGSPFTIAGGGTFTASTSLVSYRAETGTTTIASVNYNNLDLSPSSGSPIFQIGHIDSPSPSFIQKVETDWSYASSVSTTTAAFNVLAGDILVAYEVCEDYASCNSLSIASSPSLVWTTQQFILRSGYSPITVWTAPVVTNTNNLTVTFSNSSSGASHFGGAVLTFRNSGGVGVSSQAYGSGVPSLTLSGVSANSAIVLANSDWTAITTSPSYLTNAGTFTQTSYYADGAYYGVDAGYYANAGSAGNYAIGLSSPSQKYSLIGLEIKAAAAMATSSINVANNFSINGGTLVGTADVTVSGGSIIGSGSINMSGGTFEVDGTGNFGGSTSWTFNNLNIGGAAPATTTVIGTATATVTGILTVSSSSRLSAGAGKLVFTSSGTPFTVNSGGSFIAGTSLVSYQATSGTTTILSLPYYNLDLSPPSGGAIFQFAAGTYSSAAWYNLGGTWNYRKEIIIDHTKIASSTGENYANFPLLVNVTDTDLKNNASSTAADILFTAADGTTKLNYEIESYASSTGQLTAWVNVGSGGLSTTTDTVLFMYFGNASAVSQQSATSTWNTDYKSVWHLDDADNATSTDSTNFANNGSNYNTTAVSTGQIGSAGEFNGTNSYINAGNSSSLQLAHTGTVSVWLKPTYPSASNMCLVSKNDWSNDKNGYDICWGTNNYLSGEIANASSYNEIMDNNSVNDNQWHYVVLTWDGNNLNLYKDGSPSASSPLSQLIDASSTAYSLMLGKEANTADTNDFFYSGLIDETRISSVARSADWIATEYNNQSDPTIFMTVKAVESHSSEGSGTMLILGNLTTGGNGTSTVDTYTDNVPITISGNLAIGANTNFLAPASSLLTVSGNFINNGTYINNSGTIAFESSNTSVIAGASATTFYNFSSTAAGKTLQFHAGTVFTFANTFTITGNLGHNINIRSDDTSGHTQWLAQFNQSQSTVTYASVMDSGCSSSANVNLDSTSVNFGNNGSCWQFINAIVVSSGGGGGGYTLATDGGSGGGTQQGGGNFVITAGVGVSSGSVISTPQDMSVTVPTGSNIILFVSIAGQGSNSDVTSITYNGVNLTKLWGVSGAGNSAWSGGWILVNPDTGTHTLHVVFAGIPSIAEIWAQPWYGVAQGNTEGTSWRTPFTAWDGGSGSATASVEVLNVQNGDMVLDTMTDYNQTPVNDSAQTLQFQDNNPSSTSLYWGVSSKTATSSGSTTMNWTMASATWGMGAVALIPATISGSGGGATSPVDSGSGGGTQQGNGDGSVTVTKFAGGESISSSSFNLVVPAGGVAAGHGVVIYAWTNTEGSVLSVTDSRGNSYQTDASASNSSLHTGSIFLSAYITTALQPNDTITISYSSGSPYSWYVLAYDLSSLSSSGWTDKITSNVNGSSVTPSSGTTAATTQANEAVFAGFVLMSDGSLSSYGSGYSGLSSVTGAGNSRNGIVEWKHITDTGIQRGDITLTSAVGYDGLIVTYKLSSPSVIDSGGGGGASP